MLDITQLQILAQLIDNMDIAVQKIEISYNENNAEKFNLAKKEIFDVQNKVTQVLSNQ